MKCKTSEQELLTTSELKQREAKTLIANPSIVGHPVFSSYTPDNGFLFTNMKEVVL